MSMTPSLPVPGKLESFSRTVRQLAASVYVSVVSVVCIVRTQPHTCGHVYGHAIIHAIIPWKWTDMDWVDCSFQLLVVALLVGRLVGWQLASKAKQKVGK